MDEDLPSPFIKKRTKGSIRPSGSSSSIRSLAAGSPSASTSNLATRDQPAEEEEEEGNVPVVRARGKKTPAGRVKDREGVPKAKARLSFGGDDAEEEEGDSSFSIKRGPIDSPRRLLRAPGSSSTSLRADALSQSLGETSLSTPIQQASTKSVYSKEYLNELKAGTSAPAPSVRGGGAEFDDLTRSKFGAVLDADEEMAIPTSSVIAQAKERRERMRKEGGGSGSDAFVSLEVGMVSKGGESRLIREEDELGDGDEDLADFTGAKETVPLGKKANKAAAQLLRSGMIDMIQDAEEDEDDEEAREWELAQIRRGEQQRRESGNQTSFKQPYKPSPIPATSTLPSLVGVTSRLSSALATLKVSHTVDAAALTHFEHERRALDSQERELRTEVLKVEEKNVWFSDFKIFIEEVASFLDEKIPPLEKIEKDLLAIQKERYDIVTNRRYCDDSDDVSLFTGISVSTTYSLIPDEPTTTISEPEVDEFGRTREDASAPRSAVRVARRTARDRRIQSRPQPPLNCDQTENDWTDDELESADSSDLADALSSLREDLVKIFADVKVDDFRNPDLGIKARFVEWRNKFGEEYSNAFGGLALVGVWEFWARVEMALWNPFEIHQLAKTPPGLDAYRWHSNLGEYGHSAPPVSQDGHQYEEEDESEVVVNALVSSVVIPRLEKLAKESFDPLSKNQTTKALALLDEISYCVERKSQRFESLVQSFLARIETSITYSQSLIFPHLSSISLPQNAFDPSTFVVRNRFAERQLKLLRNCLRWRRYAKGIKILGQETIGAGCSLETLLVRELVAKVILPVIEAGRGTGGNEITNKVLALLQPFEAEVPPGLKRRLEGSR